MPIQDCPSNLASHFQFGHNQARLAENMLSMLQVIDNTMLLGSWRCTHHPDGSPIPEDRQHWKGGCEINRRADGWFTCNSYSLSNSGKTRNGERELFMVRPRDTRLQSYTLVFGDKQTEIEGDKQLAQMIEFALRFDKRDNYLKAAA